ncbi:hypothetical protein E2C01_048571 [Portunus trituberculatus]|uniref:Uncharacterized protein n=1 Tax=Portunus trituberculatus TaxID=210409 RepID=A0A5B7GC00_PORTR|nr:hypothetical protein [Portunus trituberculatus]
MLHYLHLHLWAKRHDSGCNQVLPGSRGLHYNALLGSDLIYHSLILFAFSLRGGRCEAPITSVGNHHQPRWCVQLNSGNDRMAVPPCHHSCVPHPCLSLSLTPFTAVPLHLLRSCTGPPFYPA